MASSINQNAFQIPNFNLAKLTYQDGSITPEAQRFFSTLTSSLQTIMNTEGTFMYPQSTDNINQLNTQQSTAAILYDNTLNKFKGCENGTFKVFSTSSTGILSAADGGTGVDNNGWQFTFNENVTFDGGFDITINSVGDTNVTLPMSGTLGTVAEMNSSNIVYYTMYGGF